MTSLTCGIKKKNWTHRKQRHIGGCKRQAVGSDRNGWVSQKIPQKSDKNKFRDTMSECWLYYIAYLTC